MLLYLTSNQKSNLIDPAVRNTNFSYEIIKNNF